MFLIAGIHENFEAPCAEAGGSGAQVEAARVFRDVNCSNNATRTDFRDVACMQDLFYAALPATVFGHQPAPLIFTAKGGVFRAWQAGGERPVAGPQRVDLTPERLSLLAHWTVDGVFDATGAMLSVERLVQMLQGTMVKAPEQESQRLMILQSL
jgi:hypothetical protein